MRELTIGQRDTIRLAYNAAAKSLDDTVIQNRIHQLSRDFGISEDEVRSIANGDEVKPAPAAESKLKRGGNRNDWTAEQLRKLMEMHNEGKGAAAIAKALGCDVKRVSMKLYNLKKSEVLRKPSPVKSPEIVPPSAPEEDAKPEPESKEAVSVPPLAVPSIHAPEDEKGDPKPFINMPGALLLLMELVREHFGAKAVIRVHASNDEHCAACIFKLGGIDYELKLEVSKNEAP